MARHISMHIPTICNSGRDLSMAQDEDNRAVYVCYLPLEQGLTIMTTVTIRQLQVSPWIPSSAKAYNQALS